MQHGPKHKPEIVKDVGKETGYEVVGQFCLVQGRDQWHACVNVVMNLCNP